MRRASALGPAVVVALATLLAGTAVGAPAGGAKAKCPIGAIRKAGDKPVDIVFCTA